MEKKKLLLKKNVMIVLIVLLLALVVAFMTFSPRMRELIREFPHRGLDPWERTFEVIDFRRGSRPPYEQWDISEDWEERILEEGKVLGMIEHDDLTDPVGFRNIREKEVALEAGSEVLVQLQNEGILSNYVPVEVFFNTESNLWVILYFYQTPRNEGLPLGGVSLNIVIDGADGSIVRIFVW